MLTSFSTALSALNATTTAIDVVGNNLANLNTPGFKTSVVSFHDLVTQSLGAGLGETQVGFGVGTPVTLREFTQGALQTTAAPLDAAIQGDGFFIAKDDTNQTVYTRGGNLMVDEGGNLTTSTGEKIQGWTTSGTNAAIDTNQPIGDIIVPVGTLKAPAVTKNVSVDLNLNASAAVGDKFSTTMETFDSLGNSHILTFNFTKAAANQWDYSVTVPDADVTTPLAPVTGQLTFDTNGHLTSPVSTDAPVQIPITGMADGATDMTGAPDPANPAAPQAISWSFYNGTAARLSQYSATSAVAANAQDGSGAANLIRVGLANGGKVVALYSDGQQLVVGQTAMALVRNPQSLLAVGNNNYALSARSAIPAVGLPNSGGRGGVLGGSVEASTVDIAKEFTNLIVLQRAYQANSRVVTTVDQLSQDTINLKQ